MTWTGNRTICKYGIDGADSDELEEKEPSDQYHNNNDVFSINFFLRDLMNYFKDSQI